MFTTCSASSTFVVVIEVEGLSMLNKLVDVIREIDNVTATQTVVGAEL